MIGVNYYPKILQANLAFHVECFSGGLSASNISTFTHTQSPNPVPLVPTSKTLKIPIKNAKNVKFVTS